MVALPSGIVSFLFTDIEGSTRLWEEFPDAMRVALAQHDSILTDAVESHSGTVFKHTGDGMCAVFTVVGDAIAAALQAQIGLSQADWGAVGSVKARMGIHTGQVEEHDGDYFGPPLNRTARLMSTGHGGQVLLSGVAADLAQGHMPDRTELKSLGTHRLRDLSNAEDVSQLLHPELPAEFPPILSLDFFQGNLPPQLTSFIGREEEIAQVNALLNDTRILTLTGIGGAGKTRLALEIGVQRIEEYADGVWLVDLAPLTDPAMVRGTIASTFGIPDEGFHDYIKSKNALIIMDNCEHVLDASAQAVQRLLQICLKVSIVATSREALGVPGEVIHRVLSLSTPESSDETFAAASKCEAVQLFVDRAMSVQPGFALSSENAASISQIARRLDGIPLAIELAAARIKSLPVDQVALRLDDRFRLLTGGSRTALPRQRTLLATIEWSYELLTPEEAELLTRLAVFQGGFSIEAAENLGVPEGEFSGDVLDLLLQLVDKSLVTVAPLGPSGEPRYRLLETMRQYAGEKLAGSGQSEDVRNQHTAYYASIVHGLQSELWGNEPQNALATLSMDRDNNRAAMAWSIEAKLVETALRMVGDFAYVWMIHRHGQEGSDRAERALALEGDSSAAARATALLSSGLIAIQLIDFPLAERRLDECVTLYEGLDNPIGTASATQFRATIPWMQGDMRSAELMLKEAGRYSNQPIADSWNTTMNMILLASASASMRDNATASEMLDQVLKERPGDWDFWGQWTRFALASFELYEAEYDKALQHFEQCLPMLRASGDHASVGAALSGMGTLAWLRSEDDKALSLHQESISELRIAGDRTDISWSMCFLHFGMRESGDLDLMLDLHDDRREMAPGDDAKSAIAENLYWFGRHSLQQEQIDRADNLLKQSLELYYEIGYERGSAFALAEVARLLVAQGDGAKAANILGAATRYAEDSGALKTGFEQSILETASKETENVMDHQAFADGLAAGRSMSLAEAYELAISDKGS